ncbi:hypothetical protein JCGZ_11149 [Jatropha curcas]|uniref:Uncharacterized protein n=1 Tax=Jatropha curcas TaxID=180498 RepID=A0A067KEG5_JATCU|nr:hypothetical protein JCGZ_11149 [Jatropha curcas]
MGDTSILVIEIEPVEKIVAASLEKLLRSDKGKDHLVIEDDEAKGESERKNIDGCFIHSSEQSSPCLPIEPFEHNEKTYPRLEIFTYVIDVLAVEPKGWEFEEKKEDKKEKKEGIEGLKVAEEESKEEEQAAREEGEENKKASAIEEVEDPAD